MRFFFFFFAESTQKSRTVMVLCAQHLCDPTSMHMWEQSIAYRSDLFLSNMMEASRLSTIF